MRRLALAPGPEMDLRLAAAILSQAAARRSADPRGYGTIRLWAARRSRPGEQ